MKVKTVLMDVDGTMTVYPEGSIMRQSPKTMLEDLIMEKDSCTREEAWNKVLACGDTETHCVTEFFPQLGVDARRYFQMMYDDLKTTTVIPEDTVHLFHFLKDAGIPLYTATTNPRFITLAKLAVGGLADFDGCEFLTGYFPGCAFRDPEGKYSKDYYKNILKYGGFDPEYTMMIGDEPIRDCIPAMKSGIRYGVNIDRKQKEPLIEKDGALFINSYHVLTAMMKDEI